MTVRATDCVAAMKTTLDTIDALVGKSVFVYDEEDLLKKIQGISSYPAVGIVYEGIVSVPGPPGASFKVGMSGELRISLILIEQGDSIIVTNQKKTNALLYLDTIRETLMTTRSPTGHFWHFMVEAPAASKKGMIFWVQRWSTPVQMPPNVPSTPM